MHHLRKIEPSKNMKAEYHFMSSFVSWIFRIILLSCSICFADEIREKFTSKEVDSWLNVEFRIANNQDVEFSDYIDFIYSRPPFVVGRKYILPEKFSSKKIHLKKGVYTRMQLLMLAKMHFHLNINIDHKNQIVIFKGQEN